MTNAVDWRIASSLLRNINRLPRETPVALLLRHSVREDLPPGDAGNRLPITETGEKLAITLGQTLGTRLKTLRSSPLIRCVQTAEALREGAGVSEDVTTDRLLGDPGIYVLDSQRAWSNWESLGHKVVMKHLVSDDAALPGMARPDEAARLLVQHMFVVARNTPGLHVFVTHDSLITATVARFQGRYLEEGDWPLYLEGACFWRSNNGIHTAYRNSECVRENST